MNGKKMRKSQFEKIRTWLLTQESEAWEKHLEVRARVEGSYQDLVDRLRVSNRQLAIEVAFVLVSRVLRTLKDVISREQFDPGHGFGHLARDLANANLLAQEDIPAKDLYIGIIAGAFHDLGCCLVDRYADKNRAIKHAEAGALFWLEISKEIGLEENISLLVYYAIAGHTHLLKQMSVECEDGIKRICLPYQDLNDDGSPRLMFWFVRQIDRLDLVGPCFLGRHYLTLDKDHLDFDGKYFSVSFAAHMRPLLRENAQIQADPNGRTLREHLALFANSQNNQSVYGRFDGQIMQAIRDKNKERSLVIISSLERPVIFSPSPHRPCQPLLAWTSWLAKRVEPSLVALSAAESLAYKFLALPEETKNCWYSAFQVTLDAYDFWRIDQLARLSAIERPHLVFPVIGDLREKL